MPMVLRPSHARGHAHHGWLDTWHSFSFAHYYDPRYMGYRSLRVINEDIIDPATGFPPHGHSDMEIITYIIEGALEHRDSTGGHSVIRRGEVQRMSAGRGIRHSEMNPSQAEAVKLLQIWLLPEEEGIDPGYEQKVFSEEDKLNRLCLIAAPQGQAGALTIRQNVRLYASVLKTGKTVRHELQSGRGCWFQIIAGKIQVNGQELEAGDGLAAESEPELLIQAREDAEFLLFDMA